MAEKRKVFNAILSLLAIILMGTAAYLVWLPPLVSTPTETKTSFGTFENRRIMELTSENGGKTYLVEDSAGTFLFNIPLKNCIIDSRFRNGRLRFHDETTGKEGFIDPYGYITFIEKEPSDIMVATPTSMPETHVSDDAPRKSATTTRFNETNLKKMLSNHPFSREAAKVLEGKLEVNDSLRRRKILNYCEHFRTAYDTKDIDFLRQVFSDNALIVVGHTVKTDESQGGLHHSDKVEYSIQSKHTYLERLSKVFESNKNVKVSFSDFHIMRHPTADGIYGVSLRQKYTSDSYSDDGFLFLLWDFRNPSMPMIHVRTWQPKQSVPDGDEPIGIGDFNLE